MHEVSIVAEILEISKKSARTNNIHKVMKITLYLGVDACVNKDAMLQAFNTLKRNTVMQHAILEMEEMPGSECMIHSIEGEEYEDDSNQ